MSRSCSSSIAAVSCARGRASPASTRCSTRSRFWSRRKSRSPRWTMRCAADLSRSAFHGRSGKAAARLSAALPRLEDAQRNIAAARGGDLGAGEQARRELSDFDALLAEVEADQAWPELGQEIEESFAIAVSWVAGHGSEAEKSTLNNAYRACKSAFVGKDADEVQRQLGV